MEEKFYLTGHSEEVIQTVALILPKICRYVNIFKDKRRDKSNNKLVSVHTQMIISYYKNIRFTKIKIRIFGDEVYTKFCSLNMSEDDTDCESFTVISIDSLVVYEKQILFASNFRNSFCKLVNQ